MGLHHSSVIPTHVKAVYGDFFPLAVPEWMDIQVPINAVKLSGTKPPAWADYKGGLILAFGDEGVEGNEEIIYFDIQMPGNYKEGTDVKFHVHWLGEDNTAGDVAWKFTHSWANVGDAFPGENTAVGIASNGATDVLLEKDVATLDGTGKKVQSMILCSLRRNSSNASDTYGGKDAYLVESDYHIQIDTIGSATEDEK